MKLFVLLSVFLYVYHAESALVSINLFGEDNQGLLDNLLSEECYDGGCDRVCQRAGYKDGSCNAGKCDCGEKVDGLNIIRKLKSRLLSQVDGCNPVQCIVWCQQHNRITGHCFNGKCYCI